MLEMKNLQEITGQESGIVIYGDAVLVVNWANECPNGMPMMAPAGNLVIDWPTEGLVVSKQEHVDDIRDVLPGCVVNQGKDEDGKDLISIEDMEVLYDYHGDICALWGYDLGLGASIDEQPTSGTVYHVEYDGSDAVVIAPDGWC